MQVGWVKIGDFRQITDYPSAIAKLLVGRGAGLILPEKYGAAPEK